MVVDDEDADGHGIGTSATSVVPAPGVDSTCSFPPSQDDAFTHADEADASSRDQAGSKPGPVVLDDGHARPGPCAARGCSRGSRRRASRCSSAPPGSRGRASSPPPWAAARRRAAPPGRARPLRSRNVSASRSTAATRPKSSRADGATRPRAGGRPGASRRRARDPIRSRPARRRSGLLERLQAEQDRRQRPTRLVVQLARQARRQLELLRLDDAAHGVAADLLGEVDRDRGAGGERLRQPQVVLGEGWVRAAALVVGDHDADRPAAHDERHVEGGADAEAPRSPAGRPPGRRAPSRRARCAPARARVRPSTRRGARARRPHTP